MMRDEVLLILESPIFGLALTAAAYYLAGLLYRRFPNPFLTPILTAAAMVILFLKATGVPYASYRVGASITEMFLPLVATTLGYSIYQQWEVLKKNAVPVLIGCTVGAGTSLVSVWAWGICWGWMS